MISNEDKTKIEEISNIHNLLSKKGKNTIAIFYDKTIVEENNISIKDTTNLPKLSCSNCKSWSKDEDYPIGICLKSTTLLDYIKQYQDEETISDEIILSNADEEVYFGANHYCSNHNG